MDQKVDLKHYDLFIDGKPVAPSTGEYTIDLDPATEEPIAEVAQGGKADVDKAVSSARAALKVWGGLRAAERGRVLQRAAALLEEHQEELIEIESLDAGKPLAAVRRQDMAAVIDTVRYYAGWCDKITGQVIPARPDALTYTVREPVGGVGAIVPWNFPPMIGMWKIAPVLACGCTVVVKPAELTPLSMLRVAELFLEAGLPPGALKVVCGKGSGVGGGLGGPPPVGKAKGASVVTGGARLGDQGYFIEPTVFANVRHEMRISQEEIFGPVLSVIPFEDEEDALRIANGTAYSLAAGVWSADIGRVHRIAAGLKAGTVWINTYGYTDVRLPWGGSGESGLGREHGDAAIEKFTQPKAIWLALDH